MVLKARLDTNSDAYVVLLFEHKSSTYKCASLQILRHMLDKENYFLQDDLYLPVIIYITANNTGGI
ncbi:Rpn family recombination-promoting nuclease/putative transposase [Peptococcaceae bacterium]|nr:Rpn family recombination-promoting nuclease/putative transposase [Peptococcaceae bacterium]